MMTNRHRDVINALLDQAIERNRRNPTLEDLAKRLGLRSRSNAHRLVQRLEERGLIRRGKPRPTFHAGCFQAFKFDDDGKALRRWV